MHDDLNGDGGFSDEQVMNLITGNVGDDDTVQDNAPEPDISDLLTALRKDLYGDDDSTDEATLEAQDDAHEDDGQDTQSDEDGDTVEPTRAADRARARLDARKLERENARLKAERQRDLELIERAKKDPFEALKLSGLSFPELVDKLRSGELKGAEPVDPHEARIAEMERQLNEARDREQRIAYEQQVSEDKEQIASVLDDLADEFPLSNSANRGITVDWLLNSMYEELKRDPGAKQDIREHMGRYEEALERELTPLFSNERSVRRLLKDEKVRQLLIKELGKGGAPKGASKGNATNGNA